MKIKYHLKNVENLVVPKRANETDAGYDIVATSGPEIVGEEITLFSSNGTSRAWKSVLYIEYGTNLYITPESKARFSNFGVEISEFHTDIQPRSSISKYNLLLANSIGLIDRGYKNQVMVRFKYIFQPIDYAISDTAGFVGKVDTSKIYNIGDRIAQLLPVQTHDADFVVVDFLPGEDRGGGFGSTDQKTTK